MNKQQLVKTSCDNNNICYTNKRKTEKSYNKINQSEFILFVRSKSLFIAGTENNTNSKCSAQRKNTWGSVTM